MTAVIAFTDRDATGVQEDEGGLEGSETGRVANNPAVEK